MNSDLATAIAMPLVGAALVALGWWSRRNLDALVGTLGTPDLLERRRAVMGRGVAACLLGGAVLVVGGVVLGVVALR